MPDSLIRALALDGRARAFAAVTTVAVEELRRIHDPSRTVTRDDLAGIPLELAALRGVDRAPVN